MSDNPYKAPDHTPAPQPLRKNHRLHDRKITSRWLTVVGFLVAGIALSFLAGMLRAPELAALGGLLTLLLSPTCSIACFYWARALGRNTAMGVLVGLFLPVLCFLLFAVLESGTSSTSAKVKRGETSGLERCPNCKKHYDRADYRSDLTEVYCSFCKHPLTLG